MKTDSAYRMLAHVPWGACVADGEGAIRYWNPQLVLWTGLAAERVIGQNLFELFPDLAVSRVKNRIMATVKTGAPAHFSSVLMPQFFPVADSQPRGRVQQATVIRSQVDEDGAAELLITVADVTELHQRAAGYRALKDKATEATRQLQQAQAALADSEAMLKEVLDAIPVRVFWKDTDSRYLGCNGEFARDAGLNHPDEIIGKLDDDLAWAAHAERYRADDRRVMDSGEARINYEERSRRSDGDRWLQISKMPLTNGNGQVIGVLCCYADITERKLEQLELERLFNELSDLKKKLEVEVVTDPLSGALNRRGMNAELSRSVSGFRRWRQPFSVMICDVDHFKKVNDTYGHEAGDLIITGVADTLKEISRETDIVARWGGEEFLVLLPATCAEGAFTMMERIRKAVEARSWEYQGQTLKITISLGGATYDQVDQDVEEVIQQADQALYEAKENGRNRSVIQIPGAILSSSEAVTR